MRGRNKPLANGTRRRRLSAAVPRMTPDTLHRAGAALYGGNWRAPLARDLGVALRTMQRWANGSHPIDPVAVLRLAALLRQRQRTIAALIPLL